MRNILLIGAAALALGTTPALADGTFFPHDGVPCVSYAPSLAGSAQTECAAKVSYKAKGHHADQDIEQSQKAKFWTHDGKPHGNIQFQTGLNVSLYTWNQDQSIKQHQSIKSNDPVYGESPYHGGDGTTQVQVGVNLALGSSNGDQSIHQGQSLENYSNDPISGTMQSQGAVNVSIGSSNDQSITQHQSLEING
jgi:hypothetical protein